MGLYHVLLPVSARSTLIDEKNACVVTAQSAAEAKLVAKADMHLPSDEAWAAATVTEITDAADLAGWRARITINDTDDSQLEQVTVTAVTPGTADSLGALLVTALNATDSIANAAYNSTTNVLTIASGSGGDDLGDKTVVPEFLPPTTWDDPTVNFPAFYTSLTHEGSSTDALSVTLVQVATPEVHYKIK